MAISKKTQTARTLITASSLLISSLSGGSLLAQTDTKSPAQATTPALNSRSLELNEQAVAQLRARNFIGAEDLFRRSVAADRYNLTAVQNLAGMYLQNRKTDAAIDLLTAYTDSPNNTGAAKDPGIYARLGDAYFAAKNTDKALKTYEKTYAMNPNFPGIATRLATLYTLKSDLPKAEKALLAAVNEEPKNGQLLSNLASVLYANKKYQDSIAAAKRALQVAPTADAYVTLGQSYQALKDSKNALISFERARDLGDKRPELAELIANAKE